MRRRRLALVLALLLMLGLAPAPILAEYTPASECGRCHQELYRSWRATFHAQAAANPVFLADVERLDAGYGPGMRVLCLSCHAPTTATTMDFSLTRPLSAEGVTCDFCHTVASVDLARKGMKLVNDLSPVKQGPGRPDSLPAHKMNSSPLLLQAEFCAGCHQWSNEQGVALLDTYGEWRASPYRGEQVACQMCHMPEILKTTILLQGRVAQRPSHLHMEMGGHSQTQLATAARLELSSFVREGKVEARVRVENFKGGHMLPTGLPSRSVILRVSLLDGEGRVLEKTEKTYQRVLGDAQGKPLDDMASWYLNATQVLADTRLAPMERRAEAFTFPLPEQSGPMMLQASLSYRLKVANLSPAQLDYEMASARMIVGGGAGPRDLTKTLGVVLGLVLLIILAFVLLKLRISGDAA
jgi:hypothetical protein